MKSSDFFKFGNAFLLLCPFKHKKCKRYQDSILENEFSWVLFAQSFLSNDSSFYRFLTLFQKFTNFNSTNDFVKGGKLHKVLMNTSSCFYPGRVYFLRSRHGLQVRKFLRTFNINFIDKILQNKRCARVRRERKHFLQFLNVSQKAFYWLFSAGTASQQWNIKSRFSGGYE